MTPEVGVFVNNPTVALALTHAVSLTLLPTCLKTGGTKALPESGGAFRIPHTVTPRTASTAGDVTNSVRS